MNKQNEQLLKRMEGHIKGMFPNSSVWCEPAAWNTITHCFKRKGDWDRIGDQLKPTQRYIIEIMLLNKDNPDLLSGDIFGCKHSYSILTTGNRSTCFRLPKNVEQTIEFVCRAMIHASWIPTVINQYKNNAAAAKAYYDAMNMN